MAGFGRTSPTGITARAEAPRLRARLSSASPRGDLVQENAPILQQEQLHPEHPCTPQRLHRSHRRRLRLRCRVGRDSCRGERGVAHVVELHGLHDRVDADLCVVAANDLRRRRNGRWWAVRGKTRSWFCAAVDFRRRRDRSTHKDGARSDSAVCVAGSDCERECECVRGL